MFIRCWGVRGSIPVSGREYIRYGGDTTCLEIITEKDDHIIVDAGTGIRRLGIKLAQNAIQDIHLIITHAHWDHILGFPFFRPLYSKDTNLTIYGGRAADQTIPEIVSRTMTSPNFPINFDSLKAAVHHRTIDNEPFCINDLAIIPIFLNHPNGGYGYKFIENGKSFVFLTDNELKSQHPGGLEYNDYFEFVKGSDLLFHDAEFTPDEYKTTRGWGHSCYKDTLALALDAGVKSFGIFHHNQERTDDKVDAIVSDCRAIASGGKNNFSCFACAEGQEFSLS